MNQTPLFHEDLNAALAHLVSALGGNQRVGTEMWPSIKSAEKAGRRVADCLNDNHQQRFTFDDLIWLLAKGRSVGVHNAMAFIASECGYAAPVPVEPEDEAAALQRKFIEQVDALGVLLTRAERLNLPGMKVVG
jgi:hypothetical protein